MAKKKKLNKDGTHRTFHWPKGWIPQSAESYVTYNEDDQDLMAFRIKIPHEFSVHDWKMVAGNHLPVKRQKWENVKPTIPEKLKNLKKLIQSKLPASTPLDYHMLYDELTENPNEWKDEIQFILREQKRCLEGFYFFNKGKITYITGEHYIFLSYWEVDNVIQYRDVDRRWFLLMNYVDSTTETVRTKLKEGTLDQYEIALDALGYPAMEKTPSRTILGINSVKGRRQGASTRSLCWTYARMRHKINSHAGIQSMDDQTAKNLFLRMIVAPWKKLPFFLKPNYSNSDSPKSTLTFEEKFTSPNRNKTDRLELNSSINFATSSEPGYYDSQRLTYYINDECGKLSDNPEKGLLKRVAVVGQCCTLGKDYVGTMINLSTVGEFNNGGRQFFEHCKDSHFEKRNSLGRTKSGCINHFISAADGMAGFIDEYGYSIIDDPTYEQIMHTGNRMGAKEFILTRREQYMNSEDPADRIKLGEWKRLYPLQWRDCFSTTALESPFNVDLLEEIEIDLLHRDVKEPIAQRGNFIWNPADQVSEFIPDPDKGRFLVSYFPPSTEISKYTRQSGKIEPIAYKRFLASFDPYKFSKTRSSKGRVSKAGFAIFFDYSLERDGSGYEDHPSANNFVVTYLHRAETKEEVFEDVKNAIIFYGCKIYYENNIGDFGEWMETNGYEGYMQYEEGKDRPGYYANENSKQSMLNDLRTWIELHGRDCNHLDLIHQLQACQGPESITDLDLLAAAGGVMIYRRLLERNHYKYEPKEEDSRGLEDWFEMY